MKKSYHHFNGLLIASGILLFMAAIPSLAVAETGSKSSSSSGQTNAAIVVPRSEFVLPTKASDGRDPFFPLSARINVSTKPEKTTEVPQPATVAMTLKGIARGVGTKRYALINDKTFTVGDEHEVLVSNSRVRVHCIEIKEDSVIIEINGARQELRMRPGI